MKIEAEHIGCKYGEYDDKYIHHKHHPTWNLIFEQPVFHPIFNELQMYMNFVIYKTMISPLSYFLVLRANQGT